MTDPARCSRPPTLEAPDADRHRERIERAVREILEAIGEDPDRDGLVRTPTRIAEMYEEIFAGLREDPSHHLTVTFEADHDEMVMVRDIPLHQRVRTPPRPVRRDARTSRTSPATTVGSPGCRRSRGSSTGSPSARRCRSGSRPRSPTRWSRSLDAERRARDDRGRALLHVDAGRQEAGVAHDHVRGAGPVQEQRRPPGPRR